MSSIVFDVSTVSWGEKVDIVAIYLGKILVENSLGLQKVLSSLWRGLERGAIIQGDGSLTMRLIVELW